MVHKCNLCVGTLSGTKSLVQLEGSNGNVLKAGVECGNAMARATDGVCELKADAGIHANVWVGPEFSKMGRIGAQNPVSYPVCTRMNCDKVYLAARAQPKTSVFIWLTTFMLYFAIGSGPRDFLNMTGDLSQKVSYWFWMRLELLGRRE